MIPSQLSPARWPNPNVAASASENGPLGVMVNDPGCMLAMLSARSDTQPGQAGSGSCSRVAGYGWAAGWSADR